MDTPMHEGWKKRGAVGMIEAEQEIKGKVSVERGRQIAQGSAQHLSRAPNQTCEKE
jgi:hypothetical protein